MASESNNISNTIFALIAFGISILIVGGNTLTILAIKNNKKLNTASNQFILGLAIADLIVGFATPYYALSRFIPFQRDGSYLTFALECLLSRVPLFASCIASIGHLTAISIDRYMSVARPLQHKAYLTPRRSWKFIAFIWAVSTVVASLPMYLNRRGLWKEEDINCMVLTVTSVYYYFFLAPLFVFFLITMVITHVGIYRIALSKSPTARKPLKMVAIIVGCFIVCWTPFMVLLHGILDHTDIENWHLFLYSFIPATLNSCINPAIYAWKMTAFRSEFCKLLGCCCKQATVNSMSEEYPTSGAVEMKTIEI